MKEPHRVSFQDAFAVGGREFELVQDRGRIFDVLSGEVVSADHDTVGSDHAHEKTQRLRIINQIVVMESTQVVPERVFDRGAAVSHVIKKMLDASCKVWEGAARMRQDDLEVRILVQRSAIDKFACQEAMLDGSVDPS